MSEKVTLTPSAKKYEGPKYNESWDVKRELEKIDKFDNKDTAKVLIRYKDIVPGKGKDAQKVNTREMIALYQQAIYLVDEVIYKRNFGTIDNGVAIGGDGLFGPKTYNALKEIQKKLKITPSDGLPGPKTTEALIKELQKTPAPAPATPAPAPATPAPAPATPAPAPATPAPAPATPAPAPRQQRSRDSGTTA